MYTHHMTRALRVTTTMPPETRDRLRALAAADHIGVSEALRRLVDREYIARIIGARTVATLPLSLPAAPEQPTE